MNTDKPKESNLDKEKIPTSEVHFKFIFWFIVGLTAFGMFLTVYIVSIYPRELSSRFADTGLMFWLSTAVSGGIGYLIGSSAQRTPTPPKKQDEISIVIPKEDS